MRGYPNKNISQHLGSNRKSRRQDVAIQRANERKERMNKNRKNALYLLKHISKSCEPDIDICTLNFLRSTANQPYLR